MFLILKTIQPCNAVAHTDEDGSIWLNLGMDLPNLSLDLPEAQKLHAELGRELNAAIAAARKVAP